MATRAYPSRYPRLGAFLAQAREGHRWSQTQITIRAQRLGLSGFSTGNVSHAERGKFVSLTPERIKAWVEVYDCDQHALLGVMLDEIYGLTLPELSAALQPPEPILTDMERAAWEHATPEARTAALAVLRALRPPSAPQPGAPKRRLVDHLERVG